MFDTISTAEQAKILNDARQMRAETMAGLFAAFFALFGRKSVARAAV